MATNAVWLSLDDKNLVRALQDARTQLTGADGELFLDFSSVLRLDTNSLTAMQELGAAARDKGVKIALRGVNINIYKVLKVAKLDPYFSFLT